VAGGEYAGGYGKNDGLGYGGLVPPIAGTDTMPVTPRTKDAAHFHAGKKDLDQENQGKQELYRTIRRPADTLETCE
jgi:hypothetical protein